MVLRNGIKGSEEAFNYKGSIDQSHINIYKIIFPITCFVLYSERCAENNSCLIKILHANEQNGILINVPHYYFLLQDSSVLSDSYLTFIRDL